MKKLIGETENSVIVLEYKANQYFSICGTEYTRHLITEAQGEAQAKEYLEDGDLWRTQVKAKNTTQGLDEWAEDVLNVDGWMHVIGDVEEVETTKGVRYTRCEGGGQINMSLSPEDLVKTFIPRADIETIFKHWSEHHLKDISEVPPEVFAEMRRIFTPETGLYDWHPDTQEACPQ